MQLFNAISWTMTIILLQHNMTNDEIQHLLQKHMDLSLVTQASVLFTFSQTQKGG